MRRLLAATALAVAAIAAPAAPAATPISESDTSAQEFFGAPAIQNPVFGIPEAPRHPFMAPNERSNLHTDAWQTDTDRLPGPLGRGMTRVSAMHTSECASVTFDSKGRIETVCVGLQGPGGGGAGLFLLDPKTLDEIAHYDLPQRQPDPSAGAALFSDFSGGGYFVLDNQDRAVVPTTTRHLFVVAQGAAGPGFSLQRDYDLSSVVPDGDKIISVLPDWKGLYWFATKRGMVGTVQPDSGEIHSFATREPIGNSFAVDETDGVYLVTDAAMYRFQSNPDGSPAITWRTTYENDGTSKPGQTEVGSGTTPTVTSAGYVAITDNADPINIVVYKRDSGAFVCRAPVFEKGASNTDQSLIGAGSSFVTENNYGYSGPAATEHGRTTTPGLERVDVDASGNCNKVWHSDEIAPSVVPKLSLANGLVYSYTKPPGVSSDPWYLTAIDFRTGRTVFKYKAGSGLGFNNNYAPVTIGPDGTAYVGVLGGLVALRDATPPPRVAQTAAGHPRSGKPRLTLKVRYGHQRVCSRRMARVTVVGRDRALVKRVDFRLGRRFVARDRRAPYSRRLRVGAGRFGRRVHARVTLVAGRRAKLHRSIVPCARGTR